MVILVEHPEPVMHSLGVCFIGPMSKERLGIAQRPLLEGGVDFKRE